MKLLLENWRKFLTEEAKLDPEIAAVLEKKGLIYNRVLGQGMFGTVVEIEDPKTGERRAAKVVEDTPNEGKVYSYVMKNRDKFGKYGKYLPKVFSVEDIEMSAPDIDRGFVDRVPFTIIQMELLEPAPEAVRRLFAAAEGPEKTDYSVRDRIAFKNPKFVIRLIKEATEDFQRMLDSVYDYRKMELYAQQAIKRIAEKFFSVGVKMRDNFSAANKVITDRTNAIYLKSKESITLLNLILDDFAYTFLHGKDKLEFLQPLNRDFYMKNLSTLDGFLRSAFGGAANVFYEEYAREMIPTSPGGYHDWPEGVAEPGGPDPEEAADMPEVKAITHALFKLKEMGLAPADVHGGNIMVRPGTKDVVFVDLGLFTITGAPRSGGAPPTFSPLAGLTRE